MDGGLSLVSPLDGLKKITNQSGLGGGFVLDLGYTSDLGKGAIPFRLSCSILSLPGKEVAYIQDTLLGLQVAGDIQVRLGASRLTLITGLSLNQWRWDHHGPTGHDTKAIKGIKFGGRMGLDYRMSPRFSTRITLQQVELGTDKQAIYGYNPSWLQLGVQYHF
jgi:hypothetical protein